MTLVLTASSRSQALAYRSELRARRTAGRLHTPFVVLPDPGDRRVGSGTSTIYVLARLATRFARRSPDATSIANLFRDRPVTIIHCGGDSRRLPAYAAHGKIFLPLPDGRTMFDHIHDDCTRLGAPGVLVATGDVFLDASAHPIDFSHEGITGVAFPGTIDRAARHGVYVRDEHGVRAFLQKPDEPTLRTHDALDDRRALIDTGLVGLTPDSVERLLLASGVDLRDGRVSVGAGLLRDAMEGAPHLDLFEHVLPCATPAGPPDDDRRAFTLRRLQDAIGDVPYTLEVIPDSRFLHVGSTNEYLDLMTADDHEGPVVRVTRTIARGVTPIDAPDSAVVECCDVRTDLTMGERTLLVGLPPEATIPVTLPDDTGLVCLPVDDDAWTAIHFGRNDTFKTSARDMGTFLGRPMTASLPERHAHADPDDTLWDVPLWHVGEIDDAIRVALDGPAGETSTADVMARVDHRRLIAHRAALETASRPTTRDVQGLVRQGITLPDARPIVRPTAHARCPVRLDFAGGWSDTPPICHDMGGAVVNAAITLDGAPPLEASARRIDERELRIVSEDLDLRRVIRSTEEVLRYDDPGDGASLARAALVLSGCAPPDRRDLAPWLDVLGGGIELRLRSNVPKGSGLGTSSALGACTIAALDRLFDRPSDDLLERTTLLEQMLSTGGGWQDQAGACTPGLKLVTTGPGLDQKPRIEHLDASGDLQHRLEARSLLWFTGVQRLAKNILQNVVGRYLADEPDARRIVQDLKADAIRMRDDIERGDLDAFARGVTRYWNLKVAFDPGASTTEIEGVFEHARPRLAGWTLPGAGGGGFLFLVARSEDDLDPLRDLLPDWPGAGCHPWAFDDVGIRVE